MNKFVKVLVTLSALLCAGCTTDAGGDDFDAVKVCPVEGVNVYGMPNRGTFIDERDGREYKYTTIGNRMWMAENLRKSEDLNSEYYSMYGAETICPLGWHLPSGDEWNELIKNVGGSEYAGLRLKATEGWVSLNRNENANGTDDCGFSMLPVVSEGKDFSGVIAEYWTSTRDHAGGYDCVKFGYMNLLYQLSDASAYLKFIRCIKD